MIVLSQAEFDAAVGEAMGLIPEDLRRLIDNVVLLVEDEPPREDPDLLGIYEGTPLPERDAFWGLGSLPDRITVFQGPLQRMCGSRVELLDEIAVTVVHEVAHYFGIDDDRLHELGWA